MFADLPPDRELAMRDSLLLTYDLWPVPCVRFALGKGSLLALSLAQLSSPLPGVCPLWASGVVCGPFQFDLVCWWLVCCLLLACSLSLSCYLLELPLALVA